ncbi:MAG: alanine dehydrogenase, partial [Deltaproteobacteria bacterium]|nr:alanine dehydrogenase [Deltaproteobacteria bacterium]
RFEQTHALQTIAGVKSRCYDVATLKPKLGVLVVGTGRCGTGARKVCEWMGLTEFSPSKVRSLSGCPDTGWFSVLGTSDIVTRIGGGRYQKAEYRDYGKERYMSSFLSYLDTGLVDVLLYTPYWDDRYPIVLGEDDFRSRMGLPWMIGDITCDVNGSLWCTQAATTIDEPAVTYDADSHSFVPGVVSGGTTVMAVDNLPCQLPSDATEHFSALLMDHVPALATLDRRNSLQTSGLSPVLQRATIVYNGELTSGYRYLEEYL